MSRRNGFTLAELLVAITILIILTTIVLAAFQRDDSDRLNAGARLLQAKIEGARSIAVSDNSVRGIRLFPDSKDPRTVRSMAYVGSSGYANGTLIDIRTNIGDPADSSDDFWEIESSSPGHWGRIHLRELMQVGSRIEIPEGSGKWYTLSDDNFDPAGNTISLSEHFDTSEWVASTMIAQGGAYDVTYRRDSMTGLLSQEIPYRLELSPSLFPNKEPMELPRGIVIDMDASGLPSSWYAPGPYWDITFDASGAPSEPFGVLSLYVTTVGDLELTRNLDPDHPANGTTTPLPQPFVPGYPPHVPQHEPYLVVVYGQSGFVTTARANLTDLDGNLRADNPFSFVVRGRESH